jgi:very-short-patch-repair endonuclease
MTQQLPDPCQRLLRTQRGVIASWQATHAGLSPYRVESLLRAGHWRRLHYGVYATFTGEPPRDAVLWAAVLRTGPRSILSHETAAERDGLIDRPSKLLHVTVPASQRLKPITGFVIHNSVRISDARHPGLLPPRTMIEETVLDLTQEATTFDDVVSLLARACQRRLTFPWMLRERAKMRAKLRWRAEIGQALDDVEAGVHSPLEYRYLRDVERAHGLPVAERQVCDRQSGRTIYRDVFYRQYGVAVELDGRASHADRHLQDNRRDNAAAACGVITLRYGWADVTERPCQTAAEVAQTLRARGWPGSLTRCRRCR